MNASRAARLARRAMRTRGDGSRGILARLAWRRLLWAGNAGDQNAAEAVWEAWLAGPDDELWTALSRWREPRPLADAAFTVAVQPERDAAARAAIGAFCARRGLAPGDEVERVLFYVLTSQAAQHRAADPDGTRLALAYQAAVEPTRAVLRAAMAGTGDLDLVRVLGARSAERVAGLSAAEAGYLSRHLAARRDWAGLWRLAQDMPLLSALDTMRQLRDAWRPPDDSEAALFGRLARADPEAIAAVSDAPATSAPSVIEIETDQPPNIGAFSPGGRRLAVMTHWWKEDRRIAVYELPDGALVEHYRDCWGDWWEGWWKSLLYTDDAIFGLASKSSRLNERRLLRFAAGRATVIEKGDWLLPLAPVPGGFAMRGPDRISLRIRSSHGELSRDVTIGVPSGFHNVAAAHLRSGRLAVVGNDDRLYVLDAASANVLGTAMLPEPRYSTKALTKCFFLARNQVAVIWADSNEAAVCQLDGGTLTVTACPRPLAAWDWWRAVQLAGEIAVIDDKNHFVRYVGGETLAETRQPRRYSVGHPELWASPDGRSHAFGGYQYRGSTRGLVEVAWGEDPGTVLELAERPLAGMGTADLAMVRAALLDPMPRASARSFLELLRDCLEHRFGTEVAIGRDLSVPASDDIRLSADDSRPPGRQAR